MPGGSAPIPCWGWAGIGIQVASPALKGDWDLGLTPSSEGSMGFWVCFLLSLAHTRGPGLGRCWNARQGTQKAQAAPCCLLQVSVLRGTPPGKRRSHWIRADSPLTAVESCQRGEWPCTVTQLNRGRAQRCHSLVSVGRGRLLLPKHRVYGTPCCPELRGAASLHLMGRGVDADTCRAT